jgi:hypothetical protein
VEHAKNAMLCTAVLKVQSFPPRIASHRTHLRERRGFPMGHLNISFLSPSPPSSSWESPDFEDRRFLYIIRSYSPYFTSPLSLYLLFTCLKVINTIYIRSWQLQLRNRGAPYQATSCSGCSISSVPWRLSLKATIRVLWVS